MFTPTVLSRHNLFITIGVILAMVCFSFMTMVPRALAATEVELQAKIDALTAQIAVFQKMIDSAQTGTSISSTTVETGEPKEGLFIGATTITTDTVRVRSMAGATGTLMSTQPAGVTGIIKEGPVKRDNHIWFKVDYATGVDGWTAGGWLRRKADVARMPVETMTHSNVGQGATLHAAKIAELERAFAVTTDVTQKQRIGEMLKKLRTEVTASSTDWRRKSAIGEWAKPATSSLESKVRQRTLTPATTTISGSTAGTTSATGEVRGASTDILTEIGKTLNDIGSLLNELETTN